MRLRAPLAKRYPRCKTTRETWYEAEIHRIAGEIALRRAEPDATKAEACFERALAVARAQRAKSWELRAAMSLARLKRDQGRPDVGRNLLAPVYELVYRRVRDGRSEGSKEPAQSAGVTNAGKNSRLPSVPRQDERKERGRCSKSRVTELQHPARKQQELKRIGILHQRRTRFVEGEGPQIVRHGVF